MEKSSKFISRMLRKNQVLLDGYQEVLALLDSRGNVSRRDISLSIRSTLQKHNEC